MIKICLRSFTCAHTRAHTNEHTHKDDVIEQNSSKEEKISFSELPADGVKLSIPEFHIMQHARPHARTLFKKGVK